MFHDIYNEVQLVPDAPYVVTNEVLYADDTVLMFFFVERIYSYWLIATEGAAYGLEINWEKIIQMSICIGGSITRPDHTVLENKREIVNLGGLITCDGRGARELIRRVSEGRSIFRIL